MDTSDLNELWETAFASTAVAAIVVTVFIIVAGVLLILYVLNAIGLYRMAKKLNHPRAWLAWIPYANTWLLFTLPKKEFCVLALNKRIENRSNAFWIWLAISLGGGFVSGIVVSVFSVIPVIGTLFGSLLGMLLNVALLLANIFLTYPAYRDLYNIFLGEAQGKGYAIASVICNYLCTIVTPILMIVASTKEPVEVEGDAYVVY